MCSVATPNSLYAITLPRPSGADRYAYVKDMCIVWPWITSAVQCSAVHPTVPVCVGNGRWRRLVALCILLGLSHTSVVCLSSDKGRFCQRAVLCTGQSLVAQHHPYPVLFALPGQV